MPRFLVFLRANREQARSHKDGAEPVGASLLAIAILQAPEMPASYSGFW